MQPETPGLLWDMLDAARFVVAQTEHVTLTTYQQNRLLRSAVERELEIIGEAARRLTRHDPQTASRLPDLPRIIAFRNVLAHGYDAIDHVRVWDVVKRSLPQFVTEVETLLHAFNDSPVSL
jgi:uncharacterized protein with HEPN domain